MAFTIPLTAKLSGATRGQLSYWRRTGVLAPEARSTGRPLLYSMRDITALRTFARLREKASSLQQIRKALSRLQEWDMFDHPSKYTLVAEDGSIRLYESPDYAVDLVKEPGQVVSVTLEDVFSEFTNIAGERVVDLRRPAEHLRIEPQRLGGWPTIAGTRIPFDSVADLIWNGDVSPADVDYYYPGVTAEAAIDALEFAKFLTAA